MTGLPGGSFTQTTAVSYTIDVDLEIPDQGAEGVILAQAGEFGGWSLYVKDGKPKYCYNWHAREKYEIEASEPLPKGKVHLRFDFDYDGSGPHEGATGTMSINGKTVGSSRIGRTRDALYSLAVETADAGRHSYSPVTTDYDPWHNDFTGTIRKVTVKQKPATCNT